MTTKVHHVKLSKKVHLQWDLTSQHGEDFTVQNCLAIALEHWSKVRETKLMMAKPQGKAGDPPTGKTTEETQPKKKKKKNKKPKNSQTDQPGTAVIVIIDKPPAIAPKDPPKVPTPSYCFWCGDENHTSKSCPKTGDLRCDNHADTKSHKTRACNIWRRANNKLVHP